MAYNPYKSMTSLRGEMTDDEKLSVAIRKASPVIEKMLKSKKPVERAAAEELKKHLAANPDKLCQYVDNGLEVDSAQSKTAQDQQFKLSVLRKMKNVWDTARSAR